MCGIFGVCFMKGHQVHSLRTVTKLVSTLFIETERRGRQATGMALITPKSIDILKGAISASNFVRGHDFHNMLSSKLKIKNTDTELERTTFILGHCRLPTKGEIDNNDNNHPLVVGNTIGIHNGIIGNDDALYDEYLYKSNFPSRIGEVDSEVIFAIIEFIKRQPKATLLDAVRKVYKEVVGSIACATVNATNPYLLSLLKTSSPIDILYLNRAGIIIFSSERKIGLTAIEEAELGNHEKIAFDTHSIMLIDVHENNYSVHSLTSTEGTTRYG